MIINKLDGKITEFQADKLLDQMEQLCELLLKNIK